MQSLPPSLSSLHKIIMSISDLWNTKSKKICITFTVIFILVVTGIIVYSLLFPKKIEPPNIFIINASTSNLVVTKDDMNGTLLFDFFIENTNKDLEMRFSDLSVWCAYQLHKVSHGRIGPFVVGSEEKTPMRVVLKRYYREHGESELTSEILQEMSQELKQQGGIYFDIFPRVTLRHFSRNVEREAFSLFYACYDVPFSADHQIQVKSQCKIYAG